MDFSRLHRAIFNRPVFWSAGCQGALEAISNEIMAYIVMSFSWAVQAVKYLRHNQFFWHQQYAN